MKKQDVMGEYTEIRNKQAAKTWEETLTAIAADLYRYGGAQGAGAFLRTMRAEDGLKLMVYKRLAVFFRGVFPPLYLLFRLLFNAVCRRCCVAMSINLRTGIGIYISHCHGITINAGCELGDNINISQNVTMGQANRGEYKGVPRLGSGIYVGPCATIAGGITVGDNALISANSLVTRDVGENSVMLGVPARRVSGEGTKGYVDFMV